MARLMRIPLSLPAALIAVWWPGSVVAQDGEPSNCHRTGQVVVSDAPRMVFSAFEFCTILDEGGRAQKDGRYVRRWDFRRPGVHQIIGHFSNGRPVGRWFIFEDGRTIWVDLGEDGDGTGAAAIRLPIDTPVPPLFSVDLHEGRFGGKWRLEPGTPSVRFGDVSEGRLDGPWRDALGTEIGRYERGRLVSGEPVPAPVGKALALLRERLRLIEKQRVLDRIELRAVKDAEKVAK